MPQVKPAYIALLRGVNVGGKNKLPMSDLARAFEACGCSDVRTFIQSGNVVFNATPACVANLANAVSDIIESRFGFRPPVILRSARQFRQAVEGNPFVKQGIDVESLHVAFLADRPSKSRVARLDSDRSPGDSFAVVGREVYLHLPNGVARTRLTNAYLDSTLETVSTLRNWRTVLELHGLLRSLRT